MGLYPINCPVCSAPHLWFSGNLDQRCQSCQDPVITPEEIVGLIGNISNRQDIVDTHAKQLTEIRKFAAKQLETYAQHALDNVDYPHDKRDEITNDLLGKVSRDLFKMAKMILEGEYGTLPT